MQPNIYNPQETVSIRQATLADTLALRELRLEALQLNPEAFGSDYEREAHQPVTIWEERLKSKTNAIFIATNSTHLVGMLGIFLSDLVKQRHNASIYGVYVRPAWRGQDLGKRLLETSLAWARQHELKYVKLAVVSSNVTAISIYHKAGFHIFGIDRAVLFHAGVYYDELLMAYEL
jgi:ribosomal protein S18 acetylase RimI-like enzyme